MLLARSLTPVIAAHLAIVRMLLIALVVLGVIVGVLIAAALMWTGDGASRSQRRTRSPHVN